MQRAYNGTARQQHYLQRAQIESPNIQMAQIGSAPETGGASGNATANVIKALFEPAQTLVEGLGKEYKTRQMALVDEEIMGATREFELFRHEYETKNQGKMALNAQADYDRKWQELTAARLRNWKGPGNEVAIDLLQKRLDEEGIHALRAGSAYESQQRRLWEANLIEQQQDDLLQYAAANPEDEAGIDFKLRNFHASLTARHPGIDHSARLNQLRGAIFNARIQAAIAQAEQTGDTSQVKAMLAPPQGASVYGGGRYRRVDTTGFEPGIADKAYAAALKYGNDPNVFAAVISIESGGRRNVVSSKGAIGPAQLMPETAKDYGVDPRDPDQNLDAASRHFQRLAKKYNNNLEYVLLAYNWGEGKLDQWLKGGKSGKLPGESVAYVQKAFNLLGIQRQKPSFGSVADMSAWGCNNVSYKMGARSATQMDCSAWAYNALLTHMNEANARAGAQVFDENARRFVASLPDKTAAGLIRGLEQSCGLLQGDQILSQAKPGMLIGVDGASHAKDRYKGIGHIGLVFEKNGQLYVTESQSKAKGVTETPLAEFVNSFHKQGRKLYGVDVNRLQTGAPLAADWGQTGAGGPYPGSSYMGGQTGAGGPYAGGPAKPGGQAFANGGPIASIPTAGPDIGGQAANANIDGDFQTYTEAGEIPPDQADPGQANQASPGAQPGSAGLPFGVEPGRFRQFQSQVAQIDQRNRALKGAQARNQIESALASMRNGEIPEGAIDRAQFELAYGANADAKIWEYNITRGLADDMANLPRMSAQALGELLQSRKPKAGEPYYSLKRKAYDALAEAASQLVTLRHQEPAKFAIAHSPQVAEKYAAMMRSIGPESIRDYLTELEAARDYLQLPDGLLLPKDAAKAFGQMLAQTPDAGAMLHNISAGAGKYASRFIEEIAGETAPNVMVLCSMADPVAIDTINRAQNTPGFMNRADLQLKNRDPAFSMDLFNSELMEQLKPILESLQAGQGFRMADAYLDCGRMHTAALMLQNPSMPMQEAARQTAERLLYDNMDFVHSYLPDRVTPAVALPKGVDAEAVAAGMGYLIQNFPVDEAAILRHPGMGKDANHRLQQDDIADNAIWVSDGSGNGAYLFCDMTCLRDKNGNPIHKTWAELASLGKNAASQEEQPYHPEDY